MDRDIGDSNGGAEGKATFLPIAHFVTLPPAAGDSGQWVAAYLIPITRDAKLWANIG
ncbi:hypothetical protein Acr_22g0008600 [Actinidia rufa]|uniref:Uncharacterized protein n=1 Tax=Actinidia rufa TaxID=165716 RepID=A0A7J0GL19_9ERIC|nr:hypothetical protein Acr_00g0017600 [Actinidia rufa]GFZ11462.1 hypothetical protein Acr_22g0008600 [Actinidia rufa]